MMVGGKLSYDVHFLARMCNSAVEGTRLFFNSKARLDSMTAWQYDTSKYPKFRHFLILSIALWYFLCFEFRSPSCACWLGGCRAGIYDCFASGPELAFEQCLGANHWASPLDMKILAVKPVTCVIFSEVPEALAHFERWTGAQTSIYNFYRNFYLHFLRFWNWLSWFCCKPAKLYLL